MAKWADSLVDELHAQILALRPFFRAGAPPDYAADLPAMIDAIVQADADHVRDVTEGCIELDVDEPAVRATAESIVDIVRAAEALWQLIVDEVADETHIAPPQGGIYGPPGGDSEDIAVRFVKLATSGFMSAAPTVSIE